MCLDCPCYYPPLRLKKSEETADFDDELFKKIRLDEQKLNAAKPIRKPLNQLTQLMKKLLLLLPLSLTACGSMDPQAAAIMAQRFEYASANPYIPPIAISDYQPIPSAIPTTVPTYQYPPFLIELLEVHDCGSVGGFDVDAGGDSMHGLLYLEQRFEALMRKHNPEVKMKKRSKRTR